MVRHTQPMGLAGSREEIRAPTSAKARITTGKTKTRFLVPQVPTSE